MSSKCHNTRFLRVPDGVSLCVRRGASNAGRECLHIQVVSIYLEEAACLETIPWPSPWMMAQLDHAGSVNPESNGSR